MDQEQEQMHPLEEEPQSKFVEEEVKIIDLEVGAKPPVVVQNEITKIVAQKLET